MKILTFDIEEWFHILDHPSINSLKKWNSFESRIEANMEIIFSIIMKHDIKATFFVVDGLQKNILI